MIEGNISKFKIPSQLTPEYRFGKTLLNIRISVESMTDGQTDFRDTCSYTFRLIERGSLDYLRYS